MKVRVSYRSPQMSVDEVFSGSTPDEIVGAMQRAVAAKVNFALRLFVNAMSPDQFAQEVVRRYNDAAGRSVPTPRSCAEFLQLGETEGLVTVLER